MIGGPDALTPYQRRLLLLVSMATLFEGFDTVLLSLALPYLGAEFGVDSAAAGRAVGTINLGTVLAFVPVRLADRYGRRPLLLLAIAGYTFATLASAATTSLPAFVAVQLVARMFMVTEIGLAYVLLSEEMPARLRGRANAFMVGSASLGGILASLAFGPVIESRFGWRGLYVLGGALLVLFPAYVWQLRETARWRELGASRTRVSLLAELAETRVVLRPPHRRTTLVASALWFATNLWVGATIFWFTYYAVNERGWDAARVGRVFFAASLIGLVGYALAGAVMDLVGRRLAAVLSFAIGSAATIVCFTTRDGWVLSAAFVVVLLMQPVSSVVGTITSELFPTAVRATGNAVASHLIGRLGMVLSGFAVGALSSGVAGSVGNAVALLAIAPLLAIPVVLWLVPETRGRSMQEIDTA